MKALSEAVKRVFTSFILHLHLLLLENDDARRSAAARLISSPPRSLLKYWQGPRC